MNLKGNYIMNLLGHGGELEDAERLVVHGGALVDVDDHAGFTPTAEKALKVMGQLALPEGDVLQQSEGMRRHTTAGRLTLPLL